VLVDGRDRGQTPATVPGLGRGAHRIRLVRDGYSTEDPPCGHHGVRYGRSR